MVPGVGGVVSQFICYGHAKQTSKRAQLFGLGNIEGVIAPESGNNAKEGGSLFAALAFGLRHSGLVAGHALSDLPPAGAFVRRAHAVARGECVRLS